jgi:hypothetical protein
MPSYPNDLRLGQFIGTTQLYDISRDPIHSKEFVTNLRNNLNIISLILNSKASGLYVNEEIVSGELLFPDYNRIDSATSSSQQLRQGYRKTIQTGTLPNSGTISIPHNIVFPPTAGDTTAIMMVIGGCATDPVNRQFIPLPFSSPVLAENIKVTVNNTHVIITTGSNRSSFTQSHIVLGYIKY